eukprot:4245167-Alexandrium_andersonii.AAC.1
MVSRLPVCDTNVALRWSLATICARFMTALTQTSYMTRDLTPVMACLSIPRPASYGATARSS